MKTRRVYVATVAAALLLGVPAAGMAQAHPMSPGKMPEQMAGMKGMHDMAGMMDGSHHLLAMAYHDNLATFARALHGNAASTKAVDLDLARPAVAEMRRSFDLMTQHHQAHMGTMSDSAKHSMSTMMAQMDTHLSALGGHLAALELAVSADAPDRDKVMEHTAAILKECDAMMSMHAKPAP